MPFAQSCQPRACKLIEKALAELQSSKSATEVWLCLLQSFGALPGFPSGSLSDFFAQQPSSSNDQTLAHELLGLPTMSQGFSAKVHYPSYLSSFLFIE